MGTAKWTEQIQERYQSDPDRGFVCRSGNTVRSKARKAKPMKPPSPTKKPEKSDMSIQIKDVLALRDRCRSKHAYSEAESHSRKLIQLTKQIYPQDNMRIAAAYENHAAILRLQGKIAEAQDFKDRGRKVRIEQAISLGSASDRDAARCTTESAGPPSVDGLVSREGQKTVSPLMALTRLKALLIQMELSVARNVMNDDWSRRRDCWTTELCLAHRQNDLAVILLGFEAHVLWEFFEPGWAGMRNHWRQLCHEASTPERLIEALLQLQGNLADRAFEAGWADHRAEWKRAVLSTNR